MIIVTDWGNDLRELNADSGKENVNRACMVVVELYMESKYNVYGSYQKKVMQNIATHNAEMNSEYR